MSLLCMILVVDNTKQLLYNVSIKFQEVVMVLEVGNPYFKNGAFRVRIGHHCVVTRRDARCRIRSWESFIEKGDVTPSSQEVLDIHKKALEVLNAYVAKKRGV